MTLPSHVTNWGVKGVVIRPSSTKSRFKSFFGDIFNFRPLRKRMAISPEMKHPIISTIISLFCLCSPAAVPWFVVTVIVRKAIKRVLWRGPWSHVCKEVVETLPALTYANPAPAVPKEIAAMFIATPFDHLTPSLMLSRLMRSGALSVFCISPKPALLVETSTRACSARLKVIMLHEFCTSAATYDFGVGVFNGGPYLAKISDDSESSEALTDCNWDKLSSCHASSIDHGARALTLSQAA